MYNPEELAGQDTASTATTEPSTAEQLSTAPHGPSSDPELLEPQLKYERLGADVKSILQDASATCLCLSEKVLALGTSTGNIHVLDYSGNEVKRFNLHTKPVKHISFDDKAEYVASCCGDSYVSISGLYTDETNKFTFKRPITVVALEPRYASRKTHEFVTGDVRGRLKLSSQGWLGRSDHVVHQGEGAIRAVAWQGSTLVWANDVGVRAYDTHTHQLFGSIPRARGGRFADCYDCRLYLHEGADLYVAWPDCIKVARIISCTDPMSGAVSKRLQVTSSVPTDYFCLGAVPHGGDLAVLVYVTDADPEQDQVGLAEDEQPAASTAAAAVPTAAASHEEQDQGPADEAAAADSRTAAAVAAADSDGFGSSEQQQQQQEGEGEGESAEAAPASAAAALEHAASSASPINIPQPVKRPQRAANAIVRSPSGPSVLEAAVASVAAVAAAAAAASANPEAAAAAADGSPAAAAQGSSTAAADADSIASESTAEVTPKDSAAAAAAGTTAAATSSSGSSPSKVPPAQKLSPVVSFAPSACSTAGGVQGSAAGALPSPSGFKSPLPSWSRSTSVASRPSDTATATEYAEEDYRPPGIPLRPELRILSLSHGPSSSSRSSSPTKPHAHAHANAEPQPGLIPANCCIEKASDALTVKGYGDYLPAQYMLVPSYGNDFALMSGGGSSRKKKQSVAGSSKKAAAAAAAAGGGKPGAAAAAAATAAAAAGTTGTDKVQNGDASADVGAAGAAADAGHSSDVSAGTAAAAAEDGSSSEVVVDDFGEFMYFIVSPKDIVIGRHRDTEDRISWFLGAGHFQAALAIAEADRSLPRAVWDTVVQAYLEYLTAAGKWSAAAGVLPQLLKDQAAVWERWVYVFAQNRQLPLLAPVLPTKLPTLHSQCYDLVLQALLVDPAHHAQLLSLVQSWPASCFHPTALIDAIAQRMQRPGGDSRELWQALATLYKSQGRPDLSLAVYMQLQLPSVFDFIQEHSLLSYLDEKAYLLMAIDEGRALELLAGHIDTLPPGAVVPGLLDAMAVAEGEGDAEGHETWRQRLFNYLDRIFRVDPSAAGEYAELCVHLYADYCPTRLMDFLQASQTYPLEAALEVAEQRGMVDEQVYILSRMGNNRSALALIIERLQDIPRAIEFVRLQRDDELIEELIDWALRSADTTGQLLDHIGGNINPLRVIQKIPEGMAIQRLRDRLRSIIADFRTQTSLREGCNAILRSDCLQLVQRLQMEVKRALPVVWVQRAGAHGAGVAAQLAAAAAAAAAAPETGADVALHAAVAAGGVKAAAAVAAEGGSTDRVVSAAGSAGSSPVKARSTAISTKAAFSFLPAAPCAGKGPQWLRYSSGSGQAMLVAGSQDVPAAALAEAAVAGSSSGCGGKCATTWGVSAASSADLLSQPVHVWIGNTQGAGDEQSCLLANEAAASPQDQQQTGKQAGSSSRRISKHHKQRSSTQPSLPSLVVA